MKKRINIIIEGEALDNLNELSRDKSMSEVIRKALALYKWIEDLKELGAKFFVEREKAKAREVEFFL